MLPERLPRYTRFFKSNTGRSWPVVDTGKNTKALAGKLDCLRGFRLPDFDPEEPRSNG